METGFVTTGGRDPIIWSAIPLRVFRKRPKPGPDYQLLHEHKLARPPNIPAARCTTCQLAVLDYSTA